MSKKQSIKKKVNYEAPNLFAERMEEFKTMFPEVLTEGKIDFDKLKTALGEETDGKPERYSFTWAGKKDAIRLLQVPSRASLVPDKDESIDFDNTQNIFIEGDNLEVLKLIWKPYFGRVKMIYIDPPYNRGADVLYQDDYTDPLGAYLTLTSQSDTEGNLLTSNPDTSGRYHSAWLSMIYPRLFLARQLLRDDGVIFVSIDDNEIHNLKMVMNEVFGEENFAFQIAWQSRQSIQNDTDVSVNHEYIVAYAKNRRQNERRLKPSNAEKWYSMLGFAAYPLPLDQTGFSNPDNDPRGDWDAHPFDAPGIRKNLSYEIINPTTQTKHLPPPGRHWSTEESTYKQLLEDGKILFGKSGDTRPQVKVFYEERKAFGQVENTWFPGDKHGTATHGTKEIQGLFDGNIVLDSPKPTTLMKSLLRIATKNNDIVMDFFAGSCTTAQGVMEINREDGGSRRFIMVQLPEPSLEDSVAKKAGYDTIAEIGKERLRRISTKMNKELEGKMALSDQDNPEDLGFKVFKLVESNFRRWAGVEEKDPEEYAKQMELYLDPLLEGWKEENVICEIAVKEGYSLSSHIKKVDKAIKNIIWKVIDDDKEQSFHICLDEKIDEEAVKALELNNDNLFICRDMALTDELAANLALQCNLRVI